MSQNYNTAIRMLQERFGRKQVLINAHVESLSKLTTPKWKFNNYESLMITAKEGVQTDCYGSLLIHILLKKLSND